MLDRRVVALLFCAGVTLGCDGSTGPEQRTDSELLTVSATEPGAFAVLYRRHAEDLLRYFVRRTLDPEAAEGWKAVAMVHHLNGRLDSAETLYLRAIEKNPNHMGAIGNLGIVYDTRGRMDEAVRWYRRAIDLNPTAPNSYMNLSSLYSTLGMYASASATLDRVAEIPLVFHHQHAHVSAPPALAKPAPASLFSCEEAVNAGYILIG